MCKAYKLFLLMSAGFILLAQNVFADTVILRDGERIKGLILDEFKDRVVVSTVEGEKSIMKSDIRSAIYDDEAKALLRKGRNQAKQMKYVEAYQTLTKAVQLDPDLNEARDQLNFLQGYLENMMRNDIAGSIKDRREKFQGVEGETLDDRLTDQLGITLVSNGKYVFVYKVVDESTAGALRPGDRIVSVWGELTAYMDEEQVAGVLLESKECKLVTERTLTPRFSMSSSIMGNIFTNGYMGIIGARLKLLKKGVIVESVTPGGSFEMSGIREGDVLHRIRQKNTRYMPMRDIIAFIKDNQNREVEIVIQRDVTLWKKER
ncbi:MAG: PDZ domain-containing protein [Candidatus Omnitrophota bacterium]